MKCGGSCSQKITNAVLSPETLEKTERHPCYSFGAHHKYSRMHLPVAPRCNISCNYCNRKFDCVNESRPGVTSEILTPESAMDKFDRVKEKINHLSVVGIAGPGDALANWESTRESIKLIRQVDPNVVFCLSTNGLMLPDFAPEIVKLGVNHVTVTLNSLDPEIGAKIYRSVNYRGRKYQGSEGARILLENQLKGIEYLTQHGVAVKINIVMIKNINDLHIPVIVKKVKEMGVFITNIMPLIPAPGSAFENYPQTSMKDLNALRDICELDLQQMRHCKQCRADAIGLLNEDRSQEFTTARGKVEETIVHQSSDAGRYRLAVASKHGVMIDQHFGYASEFTIYEGNGMDFELVERRQVEKYCLGVEECDTEETRRDKIIEALQDCDAVVSMRIGYHAGKRLAGSGIESLETCDTVENGLVQAVNILNGKNKEIA